MIRTKWFDAKIALPAKSGKYFIETAGGYASAVYYADGHWNVTLNDDGTYNADHEFKDVAYWAEIPTLDELRGYENA